MPESRNEVVQLGFRLAKLRGLERVPGLDVDGDFPFEAVQAWASEHGRQGAIDALIADGRRETQTPAGSGIEARGPCDRVLKRSLRRGTPERQQALFDGLCAPAV